MAINLPSRLGTDTPLVRDLIAEVTKGEIKIPKFQRKFVWKEPQAFDLLDSIANNYPIGSLLLWKTHIKLAAERNIGNFKLPDTADLTPTQYVLDGQQRLTVIYSCLGAPETDEGFAAAYDLDRQMFIPVPRQHDPRVFPLRWLFSTTKVLNFRTALLVFSERDVYQERLDRLIDAFTNYRIPVVVLKELSIEEVCPIFERINSSGTKLSTYDLMVAATWTPEFDLNDKVNEISNALKSKRFDSINPDTILKCLAAIHRGGMKKDQIQSLRHIASGEMEDLVGVTKKALLSTVDLLSTEFNIYSWDFLPYEALVVVLCYIYAHIPVLTEGQLRHVRQWFWRAAFSERYRVGGENFVSRDLEVVRKFVVDEAVNSKDFGGVPDADVWKKTLFRVNNSRSVAFVLSLAQAHPRNLTNGARIDTAEALSGYNKKQFHHVFPRAFLRKAAPNLEENTVVNICLLAASENNRISDADPADYMPKYIRALNEHAEDVFQSSLLPRPSMFEYATATYEEFLDARAKILEAFAARLCEGGIGWTKLPDSLA